MLVLLPNARGESIKNGKKRALLSVALVVVLVLALLPGLFSLVQAAMPWTKVGEISLSELYVVDAEVIKNSATDYEMWYTHGKTTLSLTGIASSLNTILTDNIVNDILDQDIDSLLTDLATELDVPALWSFLGDISTVVGYATSSDGINWTIVNSQVLFGSSGGWDSVGSPSVIKNGGTYEMWYTHVSSSLTEAELTTIIGDLDGTPTERRDALLALMNSATTAIGYATSSDGEIWAENPSVFTGNGSGSIWDSVATPSVINDGGTYKMWYTNAKTDLVVADLDAILADLAAFGADDLFNILDGSISSVIGYATSPDGTTWGVGTEVLAGTGGAWDSVAWPSVIKRSGSYEMWYSRGSTDLVLADFNTLQTEALALKPDLSTLWDYVKAVNLTQFLTDLDALLTTNTNINNIKALLVNSSGVIGYAASTDGVSWQVQQQPAMVGVTGSPWSSVGAPGVIYSNPYEMWHVQGIADLDAQLMLDVLQGDTLPIAYATFPGNSLGLVSGWNFVGLPVSPVSSNISDVLAGIIGNVEIVWYFDGATDTWYYYIPGGPATLAQMTGGKGYWVDMTNPGTLPLPGIEPSVPYDIPLVADWNLISLPETPSPSTIGDVLAGIIGDVEIVWYFDGATDTWYYYIPGGPATITAMTEGKAYWIQMTAPNTLTIN
jgi:hypothetical protein